MQIRKTCKYEICKHENKYEGVENVLGYKRINDCY